MEMDRLEILERVVNRHAWPFGADARRILVAVQVEASHRSIRPASFLSTGTKAVVCRDGKGGGTHIFQFGDAADVAYERGEVKATERNRLNQRFDWSEAVTAGGDTQEAAWFRTLRGVHTFLA